jgi:uncharacterized protein
MSDIYVARSSRGRIMRAGRTFDAGDVVHVSHVLVLPSDEVGTLLDQYVFSWTDTHEAVAFGFGSLFSHSKRSNVSVDKQIEGEMIVFSAKEHIDAGEELTIDYGYEPDGYDGG